MGMKKHNWVNYSRSGEIIEIVLRDYSGNRIDNFKCNTKDLKARSKIGSILHEKYGISFEPTIDVEESINAEIKVDKDELRLLKKDLEW